MTPPVYLQVEAIPVDAVTILRIYVPEGSQVYRCNGRIFDRNEDGDFDITDNTQLVAQLYQRKQTTYSENKVYPYATIDDLRPDVIEKCRKLSRVFRTDHPWQTMSDRDVVKSAQLFIRDHTTGKEGVTLAGILLLGKDATILSAVPHHRTDLILRKVNLDRYDDRDFVTTNLIDTYERIMAFIAKHLPDPFYLEGDMRLSLREKIFREVASNIIIHREYLNAFPAKLIIERGMVKTENSNRPHGFGHIDPLSFTPFPKNPIIANFFQQISRADELGSGVRNMMKYGKAYGGKHPVLEEDDIFRTTVYCPDFEGKTSVLRSQPESGVQSVTDRVLKVLEAGPAGKNEIALALGYSKRTRHLNELMAKLLDEGVVEYSIPDKPNSRLQKYRLKAV